MTEIIVLCDNYKERKRIFAKYAKLAHSIIVKGNRVILNFTKISNMLIDEIKNNFNIVSLIRGDQKISYKDRVKRGEIIEVNLTHKEGFEKGGISKCVVIQNNKGNRNSGTVIIAIIEKYEKEKYNKNIHTIIDINGEKNVVVLNNIRTIDYARIINRISFLEDIKQAEVDKKLLKILLN